MFRLPFDGCISKIYHISDIHIRKSSTRYPEYLSVFKQLHKFLDSKKDSNAMVVLTGDVVHDKLDISNEQIEILGSFLKGVSQSMPCLVTLGNHDCIVGTPNRLNSLKPVINFLQDQNHPIYLAEQSGEYIFQDSSLSFGITSPFLNQPFISASSLSLNNKKIALFHGYMNQTPVLVKNKFQNISVPHFNGYDMVLLGDIHQHEFLSPHIAYAGSLIQQSLAEPPFGHGLIEWDIPSNSGQFIEIPSHYGMHKVYFDHATPNKWTNVDKLSKYSHLLVHFNSVKPGPSDLQLLDTMTNVESIRYKNTSTINNSHKLIKSSKSAAFTFENQLAYFRNHLQSIDTPLTDISNILELHTTMYKQFKSSDIPIVPTTWSIQSLTMSNFMRYKDTHTIPFSNYACNSIVSINGLNASGKSTIIDAILFALFGKTTRSKKLIELMFDDGIDIANECSVTIELLIDNISYAITRKLQKSKNNKIIGKVVVLNNQSDVVVASESAQSNKWIKSNIASYEQLLQTSVKCQTTTNHSMVFDCTTSEIINNFNAMFNLGNLDDIRVFIRGELKDLKTKMEEMEKHVGMDDGTNVGDIEHNILILKRDMDNIMAIVPQKSLNYWQQQHNKDLHENEINRLEMDINSDSTSLKDTKSQIDSIKFIIPSFECQITALSIELEQFSTNYECMIIVQYWDSMDKQLHINSMSALEKSIYEIQNDIAKMESLKSDNLNASKATRDLLDALKHSINKQDTESIVKLHVPSLFETEMPINNEILEHDIMGVDNLINALKTQLSNSTMSNTSINTLLSELGSQIAMLSHKLMDQTNSNYDQIMKFKIEFNSVVHHIQCMIRDEENKEDPKQLQLQMENQLLQFENELLGLEKKINDNSLRLVKLLNLLETKERQLEQIEPCKAFLEKKRKFQNLEITLNEKRSEVSRLENRYKDINSKLQKNSVILIEISAHTTHFENASQFHSLNQQYSQLQGQLSVYKQLEVKYNKTRTELASLQSELVLKSIYMKLIDNKSHFIKELTSDMCTIVQDTLNSKLKEIKLSNNMEINITRETKEFNISFKYKDTNSKYRSVNSASGYEKCILDLCFRTVWCELGLMNKSLIYVLDEPFTSIDGQKKQKFDDLFDALKNEFELVLLISHDPEISGFSDYSLNITRTDEGSIIRM